MKTQRTGKFRWLEPQAQHTVLCFYVDEFNRNKHQRKMHAFKKRKTILFDKTIFFLGILWFPLLSALHFLLRALILIIGFNFSFLAALCIEITLVITFSLYICTRYKYADAYQRMSFSVERSFYNFLQCNWFATDFPRFFSCCRHFSPASDSHILSCENMILFRENIETVRHREKRSIFCFADQAEVHRSLFSVSNINFTLHS